jgi:homoserine kinase
VSRGAGDGLRRSPSAHRSSRASPRSNAPPSDAGALGSSISGAGPTIFALAADEAQGAKVLDAMRAALGGMAGRAELATVATRGARAR